MGLWKLFVGEMVTFVTFYGPWADVLPDWMKWPEYVGTSAIVGILSFEDISR